MPDKLTPESSAELLERWRRGDQDAAALLWQRYALRLLALVRGRLTPHPAGDLDPEDVVQSVFRRLFAHARDGRTVLRHSGDLWRLLVAIGLHRIQDQRRRAGARRRFLGTRQPLTEDTAELLAREPSPEEAALVADELAHALHGLEPRQQEMVVLRLQGCRIDEIADLLQCHERTVRRVLERVRRRLEWRCRWHADA